MLARGLTPVGQEQERRLRGPLLVALDALKAAERDGRRGAALVGERLAGYERVFKENKRDKGSTKNFRIVLAALGIAKSKAYRCLTAHKVSRIDGMLEASEARGIDLTEQRWSKLANRVLRERGRAGGELLPADELLAFSESQIEAERKAGESPTVQKATGPIPAKSGEPQVNHAKRKEELIEQFRKAYPEDADRRIDAIIVAALEAQVGKLKVRREE